MVCLELEHGSMTWNSDQLPILNLVLHYIDSCTRTFVAWLRQQRLDFEDDRTDEEGSEGDQELDSMMMEEIRGGEDDVWDGRGWRSRDVGGR